MCDEVVRMEERVTQAKEERRFLVKHVLQQQVMSTMLGQMAGKHAAVTTATVSPGKGGSGGGGGTRMASHSVAQLLGEAEKRSKKKSSSTPAAGGSVGGKRKAGGGSRDVLNSSGVFLLRFFSLTERRFWNQLGKVILVQFSTNVVLYLLRRKIWAGWYWF